MSANDVKIGKVKYIVRGKGYGFINNSETQEDIFFHATGCANPIFDKIEEGDTVNYIEVDSRDKKKAIEIVTI